jgi:cell wall assembly regulator SMI1
MELQSILSPVSNHLRKKGIEPELICGPRVTEARLKKAEIKMQKTIPAGLRELYQTAGDGVVFTWVDPALKELVKMQQNWRDHVMWMDDYDFPHVDDPKLAKNTYKSMKSWVPFHGEGNGDTFCIDTATKRGAVVFHQHDWYDGGTGRNGTVMAKSLEDFAEAWSKVCFQTPASLWWPSVFKAQKVNWGSNEFNRRFVFKI